MNVKLLIAQSKADADWSADDPLARAIRVADYLTKKMRVFAVAMQRFSP